MRILYGLCGVGNGHATRAKVAVPHLLESGHEVLVATSGKAYPFLKKTFPDALELGGVSLECGQDSAVDLFATLATNIERIPRTVPLTALAWEEVERFSPHAVVTDHEFFSWIFGEAHDLPIVSLDNHQILTRCVHEPDLFTGNEGGFRAMATYVHSKAPSCHHYIVTSFFFPPLRGECARNTTLIHPLLRPEVISRLNSRERPIEAGEHLLVYKYKTEAIDDAAILGALGSVPATFRIYGVSPEAKAPSNCTLRPFSEVGFLDDLESCRALINNAGMSLTGEALAFGKPIFAVPMRGQYEQILNALYLQRLGLGVAAERLEAAPLQRFLSNTDALAKNVRSAPRHDGNTALRKTLTALFG